MVIATRPVEISKLTNMLFNILQSQNVKLCSKCNASSGFTYREMMQYKLNR